MKVREAAEVLDGKIMISYGDTCIDYDKNFPLMVSAYGDFKVAKIDACIEISTSENIVYEIVVATIPIKE